MGNVKSYRDLVAWSCAHDLALCVYKITWGFPDDEKFGLTSQMRRCAISVSSNIAEGYGRFGYKDKLRFYIIARGSVTELDNQLLISRDLGFLPEEDYNDAQGKLIKSHKLLQGLITKTRSFI
jgi:four helix bundle protein